MIVKVGQRIGNKYNKAINKITASFKFMKHFLSKVKFIEF